MNEEELRAELAASRKNNFLLQETMAKIIALVHKEGSEELKIKMSRLK